jgi:hypothetical protein
VGGGFWRRGGETPTAVKWDDRIIEIREGSWSYVAGPIGRAPGALYIIFRFTSFGKGASHPLAEMQMQMQMKSRVHEKRFFFFFFFLFFLFFFFFFSLKIKRWFLKKSYI